LKIKVVASIFYWKKASTT